MKLKIFLLSLIFILIASNVWAANLSLYSTSNQINLNHEFVVDLYINTQQDSINALEGSIIFPQDLLELRDIIDGNSIVNFWIQPPAQVSNNAISFSGVIPGGYYGQQGKILSFVFKAINPGQGWLQISNSQVLINDGQGTQANLTVSNFQIYSHQLPAQPTPTPHDSTSTSPSPTQPVKVEIIDHDPPETFQPQIASSPGIFQGQWFLVFATQDKGSGIDHYEVKEGWHSFILADSPYLLKNQNLDTDIQIKAVDKSGNQRIVTLPAKHQLPWYKNYWFWGIITLIVILLIFLRKFLWSRK